LGLFPRNGFEGMFESCPIDFDKDSFEKTAQLNSGAAPDIWLSPYYAAAMYWRVKKWKFSFDITWSEISNDAFWVFSDVQECSVGQQRLFTTIDDENGNAVPVQDGLFGEALENEKQLVCGVDPVEVIYADFGEGAGQEMFHEHFGLGGGAISIKAAGGSNPAWPSAGTRVAYALFWPHQFPAFYRKRNGITELAPRIIFEAGTFRWTRIRASTWEVANPPIGTYGTFSYKLLDRTFTTDIHAFNSRASLPEFNNNLAVTATLDAVEYFEYDPNDGRGPIYDKDTGKQLRPFPD
jgi:hypothetical protein